MYGRTKVLALGAGVLSLALLGCEVHEREVVYSEPAPVVYEPGPVVVVHRAPPPVIVEREVVRPGPNYVWVNGYWRPDHDRWVWVKGHWAAPPRRDAVWVAPRYEHHGEEVHFSMGFWR